MTPASAASPFPGLRPYQASEADLFFGRDEQTDELLERLRERRFVAVVGSSGSGKSSLVRAGLIPALENSYLSGTGSVWRIAMLHPAGDPMGELSRSIGACLGISESEARTELSRTSLGLAELAVRYIHPGENLLVVVDQFEEIFRYHKAAVDRDAREASSAFVKLLLTAVRRSEVPMPGLDDLPVFVVLTMRSDYLGRSSQFRGLPEALNDSQYLVPRMSRGQLQEAIEGPAGMAGARMTSALVQRLLNDAGDNPDQLPVLQHALMRVWQVSSLARGRAEPMDLPHYEDESVGGMAKALNLDADRAFGALGGDPGKEAIARSVFQRLVDPGAVDEETRRPTCLSELTAVCGSGEAEVRAAIQPFIERGFLVLSSDADPILDISHESLIRQWDRLKTWVREESRSASVYTRLADSGVAGFESLRGMELDQALLWKEREKPNAPWARRYRPDDAIFQRAMEFLERSQRDRDEALRLAEAWRNKELRRTRLIAIVVGVAFLVAAAFGFYAYTQKGEAERQRAEAESQRTEANKQAVKANQSAADAETQRKYADAQSAVNARLAVDETRLAKEATKQRASAEQQTILAVQARGEAERNANDAGEQRRIAEEQSVLSVRLADEATKQRKAAEQQTKLALDATLEAKNQAVSATSGRLAMGAIVNREDHADLAALLSVEGRRVAATFEVRRSLQMALQSNPGLIAFLNHGGKPSEVLDVAFSPDGKILASASTDGMVRLWDLASRQPVGEPLKGPATYFAQCVRFSPDGKMLASGSGDDTIQLWDVARRQPIGDPLKGHTSYVLSIAFSPDGRMLASASGDKTVRLWDVATRRPVGDPLKGHTDSVRGIAFSPNGKLLASASSDDTVRLWDMATRLPVGDPLTGHTAEVWALAFSPDSKALATASSDKNVLLWDVASRRLLRELRGHTGSVFGVAFSPDGKTLVSGSADETVRLWDVASGEPLGEPFYGHSDYVTSVAFSPDGKTLVSGSDDQSVRLWDVSNRQRLSDSLNGHTSWVNRIVFSPDGNTMASASDDYTIRFWDVANRRPLGAPLKGSTYFNSVAFSPNGKLLASASNDHTAQFWDAASHQPVGEPLKGHTDYVQTVAFSPDGRVLASAGGDHMIRLWDVASHQPLGDPLKGHTDYVQSVAFSPDGRLLASASGDYTVRLWDVATRQPLGEPLKGHTKGVLTVAFSPDGRMLASGGNDETVRLWDVASRQPVGDPLRGHSEYVRGLVFSPDGKLLASASGDYTVRLWDVASRQLLGDPLRGHTGAVRDVAFSPDGRMLASASGDYSVRLWDVDPESWETRLCRLANRNLSLTEWQQYIGPDVPYHRTCPALPAGEGAPVK